MRFLLTVLCLLILASGVYAAKPVIPENNNPVRIDCPFEVVTYDWDFGVSNQGFTLATCDGTGGVACWQYENESHFGYCWNTNTNGTTYYANSGQALVSPTFMVNDASTLVQVSHWYDVESNFDGVNLMVNDTVVAPMDAYNTPVISTSTSYYAYCTEGEAGWSGTGLADWVLITSCWDLSAFAGQNVTLKFQFGSDSSVQYNGWFIKYVKVGGTVVATEPSTWSTIKALYN